MTRRRREPLPAGGHTPQHITPDPQAVRIPRGPAPGAQQEEGGQVSDRDKLRAERDAWRKLAKARGRILVAYRIGGRTRLAVDPADPVGVRAGAHVFVPVPAVREPRVGHEPRCPILLGCTRHNQDRRTPRRKCLSVPGEQLAWNEYCDDTGHHPSDIVQRTKTGVPVVRGVQLFAKFEEHGPLVRYTASWYEVLGKKEDDK